MTTVPVGGLDVNVTQVLQPVSPKTKSNATGNRRIQLSRQIVRISLTGVNAIRHLRTGGNSRRSRFYAKGGNPATAHLRRRTAAPDCRVPGFRFLGDAPAADGGRYKSRRGHLRVAATAPRERGEEFYFGEKISGLAGLAAEEVETMLRVASTSLVTGGRQISVLQAWYRNFMGMCWGPSGAVGRTVNGKRMVTLPE